MDEDTARGLDGGTVKPTLEQMGRAASHRELIGSATPDQHRAF